MCPQADKLHAGGTKNYVEEEKKTLSEIVPVYKKPN